MTCGTMKVTLNLSKESTMDEIQVDDKVSYEGRRGKVISLGSIMAEVSFNNGRPYKMIVYTNLLIKEQDDG